MLPLNGTKTHPLSAHALSVLARLASMDDGIPCQAINPGVVNRLRREDLAEIYQRPSPYKTHKGAKISYLRITAAGRHELLSREG